MSFQDHFTFWAQKENVEQCAKHSFLHTESEWGLKIVILVQMHYMEISYKRIFQKIVLWIIQKESLF